MMIVNQLTNIYLTKENWHVNKLSKEEADQYHERLLMQGNIITYVKEDKLIGYLEFYRINFDQWGRLVCGEKIAVLEENILDGKIAYINNMFVSEDERGLEAFNYLGRLFLSKCIDCNYFTTFRRLKKSQPIKVYKREEIFKHFKIGE